MYAAPGASTRRVHVTAVLDAPPEAEGPVSYRLGQQSGTLAPAARAAPEQAICVPAGGHADLELTAGRSATIAGPPLGPTGGPLRDVGVVVSGVQVTDDAGPC